MDCGETSFPSNDVGAAYVFAFLALRRDELLPIEDWNGRKNKSVFGHRT